jgi:hypothetical protein
MTEGLAVTVQALAANPLSLTKGQVMIVRAAKVAAGERPAEMTPRIGKIDRRLDAETFVDEVVILRLVMILNSLCGQFSGPVA